MSTFEEDRRAAFRAALNREYRRTAKPVTKTELEAREKARTTATPALHLRPGGAVQREVDAAEHAQNERRIGFLKDRLGRQKGIAQRDFRRAR